MIVNYPPEFLDKRARIPRPSGDWTLIKFTDQANDVVDDPGAILAASSFNRLTGAYSFTSKDTGPARVDGIREQIPMWTAHLGTMFSDFDVSQDMIDIYTEVSAMPLNTASYGLLVGIADAAIASRATWSGAGFCVFPTSTTVIQGAMIGPTSTGTAGTAGSNTNPVTGFFQRLWWRTDTTLTSIPSGQVNRSGADETGLTMSASGGAAFASNPALWRFIIGLIHNSTNNATANTVSGRTWARRVRAGSLIS